jgi:hydrogenase maturation protease
MPSEQGLSGQPILVFGYGNPSRGDDALGPLLVKHLEQQMMPTPADADVEVLCDFQLQIEHALDLERRRLVLFVDASVAAIEEFDFTELKPTRDDSYTSHAMSPAAVLSVFQSIKKQPPPPSFLLSIKGEQFELGEDLSVNAQNNLALAQRFVERLLANPDYELWKHYSDNGLARHAQVEQWAGHDEARPLG